MDALSGVEENGAMRQADTALRTAGGGVVLLRLPGLAASGDDSEQLGLATPTFQDVPLKPVAFYKANNATKLLVSASAVLELTKSLAYDSAEVLFETAAGIVVDDVLYPIEKSMASRVMGRPYCYWLTLSIPAR